MERLTIKELAAYATHGLRITLPNGKIKKLKSIDFELSILNFGWKDTVYLKDETVLPLLRPLSQLTEEIEHNGERFVPKEKIPNYTKVDENGRLYVLVDGTQWKSNPLRWDYETVNWLISLHFDVFGLIDRGLALPIDGKEVEGE